MTQKKCTIFHYMNFHIVKNCALFIESHNHMNHITYNILLHNNNKRINTQASNMILPDDVAHLIDYRDYSSQTIRPSLEQHG